MLQRGEEFIGLLKIFYKSNKLQHNPEKTTFMMIGMEFANKIRIILYAHSRQARIVQATVSADAMW